jgi:hypothetical protein
MPDPIRLVDVVLEGRIAGCFRCMSPDFRDGWPGTSIADGPGENLASNV